jgi:Xaa-Pro aminopeptidase
MEPGAIAIFVSNDEMPSNGDAHYPFRQNSDLFWLSGITQEDSMVILFPDHPDPRYREVLVLVRPNELKEKWDGRRLRAEEARQISGIGTVLWLDNWDALLQQWIHMADSIYLDTNENDRKGGPLITREYRYITEMQERYPLHGTGGVPVSCGHCGRSRRRWRWVDAGSGGYNGGYVPAFAGFIRPGVMEYEIEAEIYRGFCRGVRRVRPTKALSPVGTGRGRCIILPITGMP